MDGHDTRASGAAELGGRENSGGHGHSLFLVRPIIGYRAGHVDNEHKRKWPRIQDARLSTNYGNGWNNTAKGTQQTKTQEKGNDRRTLRVY